MEIPAISKEWRTKLPSLEDLRSSRRTSVVRPHPRIAKQAFEAAVRRLRGPLGRAYRLLRDLNDARRVRQHFKSGVRLISFDEVSEENLSDRWHTTAEPSPRLTIVVATYHQTPALDCLLKSLACQTLQNFKVLVIHDGPDVDTSDLVTGYAQMNPENFEYMQTELRYNDFGHSLRQIGIDRAETEFILLTNGDNYYAPRFVEFMFEGIDRFALDVVLCDMVHSHKDPGCRVQTSYGFFRTLPLPNYLDMGCFIARTSMAKRVGMRDKSFNGDAVYFDDLLASTYGTKVGKIGKVLLVHN